MPEFKTHNLWPIPVYEGEELVRPEWLDFIKKIEYERMKVGNGDISIDRYILENMSDLKKEIEKHCKLYVEKYLKVSKNAHFYLQNSWAVRHLPGDKSQSHIHGSSLLSGVYYLQTPEDSGDLVFSKEYGYTNLFHNTIRFHYDDTNHINCDSYTIDTKENKILLFPSHLTHNVKQNNSNDDRYSLAFNFFVKGKFGDEESYLEIK